MPPHEPALARTFVRTVHRKRHAILGTACALGLVLAPLTASAVVVGVTTDGQSSETSASISAQPSAGTAAPIAGPYSRPESDGRRPRTMR